MAANAARVRIQGAAASPPVVSLSLAPLGVPLELELAGTAPREPLIAACERWGGVIDPAAPRLKLRLELAPGLAGRHPAAMAVAGSTLRLHGRSADGFADAGIGLAECAVSPDWFDAPEALRAEVLEPLVLYLLARHGRAPVHAAGFLAGGRAIVLAGPSGSGKSCLACAADRAGFRVLSEDTLHVQLAPRLRLWGWPGPAHLLPADAPDDRSSPMRLRNGKAKHAVPLRSASVWALGGELGAFCLLRRGAALALEPLTTDAALRRFERLEPGFDCVADAIREAYAALIGQGAWQLTLSDDPAAAIRFLAANLARLTGEPAA